MPIPVPTSANVYGAMQLLPALKTLQDHEKLYIIQYLAADLSQPKHETILPESQYPVWSPFDSYEAAEAMLKAKKEYLTMGVENL
jgi:hypothetical protein